MPHPKRGIIANAKSIFTESIFSGVLSKILFEPTVKVRKSGVRDESIGSFVSRRYGSALTDNMLSALFHGIYAGDIYKLSARQLMSGAWYMETRDQEGSGINAELLDLLFKRQALLPFDKVRMINRMNIDNIGDKNAMSFLHMKMLQTAMYSFMKGLGELKDVLLEYLQAHQNVTIKTKAKVERLDFDKDNQKFSVSSANNDLADQKFDYAVCTLGQKALANRIAPPAEERSADSKYSTLINSLETGAPTSVNVMVVNLYYKSPDLPIPPGFGYLIPQSVPAEQNPERALGVIFSSQTAGPRGKDAFVETQVFSEEAEKELEAIRNSDKAKIEFAKSGEEPWERLMKGMVFKRLQVGQDTASGTKLAVMLGGHWWSGWSESDLPDEQTAIEMAKSVIARHLKITEEPMLAKARLQREAIPQYQVGYRDDMARIHGDLVSAFDGRLKVLGPWWQGGVGVNDCVKNARDTSRRIREAWDDQTGLEDYVGEEKWVLIDKRTGMQVFDPLSQR